MLFESLVAPALQSVNSLISQFHLSPEQAAQAQQAVADATAKAQKDAQDCEVSMAKLSNEDRASARTREMGVRLALGAQRGAVLALVMRGGLRLAGAGIVLGLIGAMGLTQLLRSLLFGVGPTDPLTFAAVPILLVSAALLACWLPARRAANVDPMEALRYE